MATYINYRTYQPLYPGQPQKQIDDLDPTSTFVDLVKRICEKEQRDANDTAHLFLPSGIPLNRHAASKTWTLEDWQIKSGDLLLVIFSRKQHDGQDDYCPPPQKGSKSDHKHGSCILKVRGLKCCEIQIDLNQDSCMTLYEKVFSATEIPIPWITLRYVNNHKGKESILIKKSPDIPVSQLTLTNYSTLDFEMNPDPANPLWFGLFDATKYQPLTPQTKSGCSTFYSTLYIISHYISQDGTDLNVLGYLYHLTVCPPLVHALAMLFDKRMISVSQRVAIHEILYQLFLEMTNSDQRNMVFEKSIECWSNIFTHASPKFKLPEDFDHSQSFYCNKCNNRLTYPVCTTDTSDTCLCTVCASIDHNRLDGKFYLHPKLLQLMIALPLEEDASFWITQFQGDLNKDQLPRKPEPRSARALHNVPSYLIVKIPTHLRNNPQGNLPPCLTRNGQNEVVIFTERAKVLERGKTHYLLNPSTGKEVLVDLNEVAGDLQTHITKGDYASNSYITQPPQEAVLVVLDISGSMSCHDYPAYYRWSRLDVAKLVFTLFAERIIAFGIEVAVGLTIFNQDTTRISKVSEAEQTLVNILIEKANDINTSGTTALWKALTHACDDLSEIKHKYKLYKQRILCLTDGCDNSGSVGRLECVKKLCRQGVVMDCILIGDANIAAKAAALATGGQAFYFEEIEELLKLPDKEAFLSLRLRRPTLPLSSITDSSLKQLEYASYTDPKNLVAQRPTTPSSKPTYAIPLLKSLATKPNQDDVASYKPILVALADIVKYPLTGIQVLPNENNLLFWKCLMSGPPYTAYSQGVFVLNIHFSADYPTTLPDIRFETKILHCNVTKDGRICHPMLNRLYYSPEHSMRDILVMIYELLCLPSKEDLADGSKSIMYVTDNAKYEQKAKLVTQQEASYTIETLQTRLTGSKLSPSDDYDDIPHDAWFLLKHD
jgi:ubiquitin-protein ligase